MRLAAVPPVCAAGLISWRRHGTCVVTTATRRDAVLATGTTAAALAAALVALPVPYANAEGVAALEPMEALKGKDYGKPRMTCVPGA